MRLELSPELEANLLAQAHACGLTLEAYLNQVLRSASLFPTQEEALEHAENPTSQHVAAEELFAEPRRDGDYVVNKAIASSRKSLAQLFAESPFKGLDLRFERDPDNGRSDAL